jgi:hypothetical protein
MKPQRTFTSKFKCQVIEELLSGKPAAPKSAVNMILPHDFVKNQL